MKATKYWCACHCGCGHNIIAGTEFNIIDGGFFIEGHESRDVFEDLDIPVSVKLSEIRAEEIEQQPVCELPLFETEHVEQLQLF